MTTRSEDTKQRLFDAAAQEFARHGIAGARTGRIASAAHANEALLFRYFGSKQQLFDQVYAELVESTVDAVPITPADLPAYAGALFDHYRSHAAVLRLSMWGALERPNAAVTSAVAEATELKTAAIAAAQRSGVVTMRQPAAEILALVIHLSLFGADALPATTPPVDSAGRRAIIVDAVASLVRPDRAT